MEAYTKRREFLKNAAMATGVAALGSPQEFGVAESTAASAPILWQIGKTDGGCAEFALAPDAYKRFPQNFGSPDHAYYVGLSKPESDWPFILPGPLDTWGGSGDKGRWDQMNTLPIGFVLEQASVSGRCVLTIDLSDTAPEHPPAAAHSDQWRPV